MTLQDTLSMYNPPYTFTYLLSVDDLTNRDEETIKSPAEPENKTEMKTQSLRTAWGTSQKFWCLDITHPQRI